MLFRSRKKGVPAEVSNTAGTFVCNHLIYGVLHYIAIRQYAARAGFMHVPYLDSPIKKNVSSDVSPPTLTLSEMIVGTKAAIIAATKRRADIVTLGGKLH